MNCKPGDLAVIRRCPPVPECVGRIVECVAFRGPYLVNGMTFPDVWEVKWGDKDARAATGYEGWGMPDAWLSRINAPGITDDEVADLYAPAPQQPEHA